MAKFTDYLPGGEHSPAKEGIDSEIKDASQQQLERQQEADSTQTNWEERYKELEKLNSRQAQTLGDYRKTIDDFITNPTPEDNANGEEEHTPITYEDLYADANGAVLRAVDKHPAIREAQELKKRFVDNERAVAREEFVNKHSDYADIVGTPEFQNWVVDNPMRAELYQRGNQYDFDSADALISLYKAEKGVNESQARQAIDDAELVESSGEIVTEPPRYSRSEYINKLMRSKQGDLEAEAWVKSHAANYRLALQAGNVRD